MEVCATCRLWECDVVRYLLLPSSGRRERGVHAPIMHSTTVWSKFSSSGSGWSQVEDSG